MEYNEQLLKNIILYICNKAPRGKLGSVKLNKILWFFEKFCFDTFGHTVTGEIYIKKEHGPVASHIDEVIADLENENALKVRRSEKFQPTEYICKRPAPELGLSEKIQGVLDVCINSICNNHTSVTISRKSHDKIWESADMGDELHFAAYYRKIIPPSESVLTWAHSAKA